MVDPYTFVKNSFSKSAEEVIPRCVKKRLKSQKEKHFSCFSERLSIGKPYFAFTAFCKIVYLSRTRAKITVLSTRSSFTASLTASYTLCVTNSFFIGRNFFTVNNLSRPFTEFISPKESKSV